MRNWGLAIILFTMTYMGVAQVGNTIALSLFEEFEIPKGEDLLALHSTRTASAYLITKKPGILFLRQLADSSLKPIKVLSIKSNDTKKLIRHHLVGDSIIGLVKSINKDRTENFEVVVYTLRSDQLAEAYRHTLEIRNRPADKNAEPIFFHVSGNGKYAVTLRQVAYELSPEAIIEVEVLSFPKNESKKFRLPLPYTGDNLEITDVEITSGGIVNFTANSGVKLNSPFLKKHLVYSFNPSIKDLHEFDLSRDKLYIQQMLLRSRGEQLDILTTHTNDPMAKTTSNGSGWVQIDSNGRHIAVKTTTPFNEALTESLKLTDRSKSGAVEHLQADDIVQIGDKSVGLMHQQYRDQVCTTDPRTGILTCTDQYHHDGIIVQFLEKHMEPIVVNRAQIDYDREGAYMGYTWYAIDENLWILYNDHQRNTTLEAERAMNNPSRSTLRYVRIDSTGKFNSNTIDVPTGRGMVLMPSTRGFEKFGNIYHLFSNGKDFQIGMIDIKK
ncbi:MAG: hypothetical protein Salg2KO_09460 [Salibacteraceae bacterium]